MEGATERIIQTLDDFGLHWDEEIYYQSRARHHYQQILQELDLRQLIYRCQCTRKALRAIGNESNSQVYPGFCRNQINSADIPHAVRIKTEEIQITFDDQLQGQISECLAKQHGDFIIKRKDSIVAYQLAVVIDDYQQQVNHIVRGSDLLDSTIKHLYIQKLLGYPQPQYMHLPVILGDDGCKLSKQTFAQAVDSQNPGRTIYRLLQLLKQNPPEELIDARAEELLTWGIQHWNPAQLKNIRAIQ